MAARRRRGGLRVPPKKENDSPLFELLNHKAAEPEDAADYGRRSEGGRKTPPVKSTAPVEPMTVSVLTSRLKAAVAAEFPGPVMVRGEITNFRRAASRHLYFSLKDDESQLDCVMWRSAAGKLKFEPEDGLEAICRGRVSIYEPRSAYQLVVDSIIPKGVGELQLAFEQLRKKLAAAGLFDAERKKPAPFLPRVLGIVTSSAGAALRDILKVTWRRAPGMHVVLCPAQVQGEGAAESIAAAIKLFNRAGAADVLIVGRGGGSLEDLWAFNEEAVVRAIAASTIPVISAVGHETDTTLADLAADLRAPTPSAAAELAVPETVQLLEDLDSRAERLENAMRGLIDWNRQRLDAWEKSYALRHPREKLGVTRRRLDDIAARLHPACRRKIEAAGAEVRKLAAKLDTLSPLAVLARGYSITTDAGTGEVIKNAESVERGDRLRTRLGRGMLLGEVIEVEQDGGGDTSR